MDEPNGRSDARIGGADRITDAIDTGGGPAATGAGRGGGEDGWASGEAPTRSRRSRWRTAAVGAALALAVSGVAGGVGYAVGSVTSAVGEHGHHDRGVSDGADTGRLGGFGVVGDAGPDTDGGAGFGAGG